MRTTPGVVLATDQQFAEVTVLEEAALRQGRLRRRRSWYLRGAQLVTVAGLIALWQFDVSRLLFGSPSTVLNVLWSWAQSGARWHDVSVTVEEALSGYVIGTLVGLAVAAAASSARLIYLVVSPIAAALNAVPKVALAPLSILVFGIGMQSKIYFVVATTFFLAFWTLVGGLRSIDPLYPRSARMLGASRYWLVREVYLPAAIGWIMASLRLSLSWAFVAAVVGEYIGGLNGIGVLIGRGQSAFRQDEVVAGLLLVGAIAIIGDRLLLRLESRFTRWRLP